MINLHSVSAERGGRNVLNNISCHFPARQTTAILGRSGSGKSTMLRLVNRLLETSAGTILYSNRELREHNEFDLRKSIGFVPQSLGLFPNWSAHRQIARFLRSPNSVTALAKSVGLQTELLDRYPGELSGGEQQRVAIARALASNPPALMMDEPFSALDPILRRDMQDLVLSLDKTILFVTHDLREALRISKHIVFLSQGRLVFEGATEAFATCPDAEVQAYFRTLEA